MNIVIYRTLKRFITRVYHVNLSLGEHKINTSSDENDPNLIFQSCVQKTFLQGKKNLLLTKHAFRTYLPVSVNCYGKFSQDTPPPN